MELSLIGKCMISVIRFLPTVQYLLQKVTEQKMDGTWCVCWQNNKESIEYQIGTIDIKQLYRGCSGHFYSGAGKWPFKAEYTNGKFEGTYYTQDNLRGHFVMVFTDKSINYHQMLGEWTGIMEDQGDGSVKRSPWLKMCFADISCFNQKCCMKEFGDDEGICAKKHNNLHDNYNQLTHIA